MLEYPNYEERKKMYESYFGVGLLNVPIEERLAVIGLICNVTHQLQMKKPDVTCYKVLMKIVEKEFLLNENFRRFLEGLAIMCEDTMRYAKDYPDFGIKSGKERISKIKEILNFYIPF